MEWHASNLSASLLHDAIFQLPHFHAVSREARQALQQLESLRVDERYPQQLVSSLLEGRLTRLTSLTAGAPSYQPGCFWALVGKLSRLQHLDVAINGVQHSALELLRHHG